MATRRPAEVFPPGEFVREEMDARGWSQADLAEILGRPAKAVSEVVTGKRSITPDTATDLAAAFGTSPQFWMNLESTFQLGQVKSGRSDVARRASVYAKAPVREMIRRGWIAETKSIDELETRVLGFLGISSLDDEPVVFPHAARKSSTYSACTNEQITWLIRARQLAAGIDARPYSHNKMDRALVRLRGLVRSRHDVAHVPQFLAEAGVRLVIVEPLARGKIDGATFFVDKAMPAVALSLRYDRLDHFWFTLIHELVHVRNGESAIDSDVSADYAAKPLHEKQADAAAGEFFVTQEQLDEFVNATGPTYSTAQIVAFAQSIDVDPGIVVGQLHHRRAVPWSSFRKLLLPVRETLITSTVTDGWGTATLHQ